VDEMEQRPRRQLVGRAVEERAERRVHDAKWVGPAMQSGARAVASSRSRSCVSASTRARARSRAPGWRHRPRCARSRRRRPRA
jgi:hypothetical protein